MYCDDAAVLGLPSDSDHLLQASDDFDPDLAKIQRSAGQVSHDTRRYLVIPESAQTGIAAGIMGLLRWVFLMGYPYLEHYRILQGVAMPGKIDYETDIVAWSREQARWLKAGRFDHHGFYLSPRVLEIIQTMLVE